MLLSTLMRAKRKVPVVRPRLRLTLALAALGPLVGAALLGCGQASIPPLTCGTVSLDHLGHLINGRQAEQAETCFYQGFQPCRAVSIGLSQMTGTDTGTESIFSVQAASAGSCRISEAEYSDVNTNQTATTTATCTGLSRQNGGLLVSSCGAGRNVYLPAATPTPAPSPSPTR
jgi:hypothetical protein